MRVARRSAERPEETFFLEKHRDLLRRLDDRRRAMVELLEATASRESVKAALATLDGEWSDVTRAAAVRLRAHDVRIHEAWTHVPQTWSCPCCRRPKSGLFRLASGRVLQGKLDDHHDHFVSYGNHRIKEAFGEARLAAMQFHIQLALADAQNFVGGFTLSLICPDCNTADGQGKLAVADLLKDDRDWFSFSIEDIRDFIHPPQPNQPHRIDPPRVRDVFLRRAHDRGLRTRKSIIDGTIRFLEQEIHWKSREQTESVQEAYDAYIDLLADLGLGGNARTALGSLSASVLDANPKRWRVPPKRKFIAPDAFLIDRYMAEQAPDRFRQLPPSWRCPGCDRTARETVRYSNRKAEKGGFRLHGNAVELGRSGCSEMVCSDCALMARNLAGEAGCASDDILPSDIMQAIRRNRNRRHLPAKFHATIDLVVKGIRERVAATAREEWTSWNHAASNDDDFDDDDFVALP